MTLPSLVLIATVFATTIVWELLVYAQMYTYKQWLWMDADNFLRTHGRYVAEAGFTTYTPIVLCFIATATLLFIRPPTVPLPPVIVLNVVNILATIITFWLPVPIHIRIDREQRYAEHDLALLLRYNLFRVILSSINTVIILYLLAKALM